METLKEAGELRESYCHLSAAWVPIKIEVTMADQIARDLKELVALRAYFKESLEEIVSYRSLKIPEHWPRWDGRTASGVPVRPMLLLDPAFP